jgi:spore coat polysaccharide biosynthesis protein SpsF
MLARHVRRARRASSIDELVVATTTLDADLPIVELCARRGWPCFRGSEDDVLDRYYQAALAHDAEAVVRITSDCPLIDPELIDQVVEEFTGHQPEVHYVSNFLPRRTFPRGLDTEVIRFTALERAWREDTAPNQREHVTPYIYRNRDRFRIRGVMNEVDHSSMRWTVDLPEDLALVRCVYEHFGHDRFSWRDVLAVLEERPDWLDINRDVEQKAIP